MPHIKIQKLEIIYKYNNFQLNIQQNSQKK